MITHRQSDALCWLFCLAAIVVITGCPGSESPSQEDAVLLRIDRHTVTWAQFERAFETARIAYSDDRSVDSEIIEDARLRLLDQMTEEIVINCRAEEMGIKLNDAELEVAVLEIKKDYPEDEFTQMLLESAVPYTLWKDRLRVRLLMEKVVDRELVQPVKITAQDIEEYHKAHEEDFAVKDAQQPEMDLNRHIVEQIRREKVEAAYPHWMDGLRKRYAVEINWKLWDQSQGPGTGSSNNGKESLP